MPQPMRPTNQLVKDHTNMNCLRQRSHANAETTAERPTLSLLLANGVGSKCSAKDSKRSIASFMTRYNVPHLQSAKEGKLKPCTTSAKAPKPSLRKLRAAVLRFPSMRKKLEMALSRVNHNGNQGSELNPLCKSKSQPCFKPGTETALGQNHW